jgi:3-hydroxybutyryl-CoA dehydratase
VTGDTNPIHLNETYAEGTIFKTRIAHGMLLAGYISALLGNRFPGPGTIYLKQELQFLAPVPIGDTVTIRVEVKELDVPKNRITLRTSCMNQNGVTVLDGLALVMAPKQ